MTENRTILKRLKISIEGNRRNRLDYVYGTRKINFAMKLNEVSAAKKFPDYILT